MYRIKSGIFGQTDNFGQQPCSEVELSGDDTMCGSRGGDRGSGRPPPGKSQVIWVSIEINTWTLDPSTP